MNFQDSFKFGIAGLGGYAASIRRYILKAAEQTVPDLPPIRLHAVCEPAQNQHAALIDELKAKGVQVHADIDGLLQSDVEAVWLPVPIDLHRSFTEKSLAAGKAVMCEKPAAGCLEDLDAMIAARDRSGLPVAIGFQHIYDPIILDLKRRLLRGQIGRIRSATLYGCWPRGDQYYQRASWAGAMKRNGTWVLDSPAMNAMAHYINLGLFWLSSQMETSAAPMAVEAELYRARTIENCDTVCLRLRLGGDVPFLVLLTHACAKTIHPTLKLHGENGVMTWRHEGGVTIEESAGNTRWNSRSETDLMHQHMVRRFVRAVRRLEPNQGPLATLEMARHHLMVINGASEVARVQRIPDSFIEPSPSNKGTVAAICGIESLFETCAARQQMLHESGLAPWAVAAAGRDLANYRHFAGPASGA